MFEIPREIHKNHSNYCKGIIQVYFYCKRIDSLNQHLSLVLQENLDQEKYKESFKLEIHNNHSNYKRNTQEIHSIG